MTKRPSRPAPLRPQRNDAHGPATGSADWFVARTLRGLMDRLALRGGFLGAFDTTGGFACQVLPDGIQLAAHSGETAGAVLAENAAGLSFAHRDAADLALLNVDPVMRDSYSTAPDWHIGAGGAMTALVRVPRLALHMECKNALVDPLFSGSDVAGAVLIIRAEQRPLHLN